MIATDCSRFFLHDSVEAIASNHDCYRLIRLLPIAPIGAFFGTWHRGGRGNSNKGGGVCQASNHSNRKQSWLLGIALISFYMTQLKHRQSEAIMIAIDWYDCYQLLPLVHFLAHGTGGAGVIVIKEGGCATKAIVAIESNHDCYGLLSILSTWLSWSNRKQSWLLSIDTNATDCSHWCIFWHMAKGGQG